MNFDYSDKVEALRARLIDFIDNEVTPGETVYHAQ